MLKHIIAEHCNVWIDENCPKLVHTLKNVKVSVVFKDNKDILEPFSAILKSRRSLCNSLFSTNKGEINCEFSINYQSLLTKEQIIIIKACTPIICIAAKPGKPIPKPIATPYNIAF